MHPRMINSFPVWQLIYVQIWHVHFSAYRYNHHYFVYVVMVWRSVSRESVPMMMMMMYFDYGGGDSMMMLTTTVMIEKEELTHIMTKKKKQQELLFLGKSCY